MEIKEISLRTLWVGVLIFGGLTSIGVGGILSIFWLSLAGLIMILSGVYIGILNNKTQPKKERKR